MDIIKIIGIGFIGLVISSIFKEYKKEYVIYISLVCGLIIFFICLEKLSHVILLLNNLAKKVGTNSYFILLLLKITGIAILSEFAVSICKDAGETSIASKIDLGSKVIIMGISIPIINTLLETLLGIIQT